jgi:hypothetical protein
MKNAKFAVTLALFVMMGCSNENPVSKPDAEMIPFTGSYSGKSVVTPSIPLVGFSGCSDELDMDCLEGNGEFSPLGRAAVVHAHCTDSKPLSSHPLTLKAVNGKIAMIGAHGDEIYADYTGKVIYSDKIVEGRPDKIVLEGEFTITGGAGKCAGACGNGSITCKMIVPENEVTAELKGVVSLPHASSH